MRSGEYVVLNASGCVDQIFGTSPTEYAQALMWAVSQAIIGRTRYHVAYMTDDGAWEYVVTVQHPSC